MAARAVSQTINDERTCEHPAQQTEPAVDAPPRDTNGFAGLLGLAIFAPLVAAIATLTLVSGLPRPMQGEDVVVPWSACWACYYILAAVVPWALSGLGIRSWRRRLAFFAALIAFALLYRYTIGLEELMSKAYRRGL